MAADLCAFDDGESGEVVTLTEVESEEETSCHKPA
jgi:hypothetical protein